MGAHNSAAYVRDAKNRALRSGLEWFCRILGVFCKQAGAVLELQGANASTILQSLLNPAYLGTSCTALGAHTPCLHKSFFSRAFRTVLLPAYN